MKEFLHRCQNLRSYGGGTGIRKMVGDEGTRRRVWREGCHEGFLESCIYLVLALLLLLLSRVKKTLSLE
jgi:hypothetical protein